MKTSVEYDQKYLAHALEILERYLLSEELYWQVSIKPPKGMSPYPSITPGNILLALRRLMARGADEGLRQKLLTIRKEWEAHWRQKAEHEARARLRQWRLFLTQSGQETDDPAPYYHYEVRERVILQLIEDDLGDLPPDVAVELSKMDNLLKASFVPGEFVWEKDLEPAFPRDKFWFLYGTMRPRE